MKWIEGQPCGPSIHRAIRRGTQGERLLMIQHELVQLARGPLRDIQTRLPLEERRTDARDENFHGAFLCMFHPSKNINRSSRVFREMKWIERQPCGPSIHRAIRRGTRGERILMIKHEFVQLARGPLQDIQTRLPLEERRTDARDENFHGAFLCMFRIPKASAVHPECFVK